jgi:hypothetical protein
MDPGSFSSVVEVLGQDELSVSVCEELYRTADHRANRSSAFSFLCRLKESKKA